MTRTVQAGSSQLRIAGDPALASGVDRRVTVARMAYWGLLAALPVLLIGALAWPLLFTSDALSGDWSHHLALVWSQSQELRANHHPSLFYNYSHAILYPQFAFYGATLYTIVGTASLLAGGAPIETYIATYLLGFVAAYGGWYWMARMAGLGRWLAQVPGLIFITSGYYVTLIYGRGDWPEFLAVSTIPLLLASGLSVLRAERLYLRPALALAGSAVIFFGSHDLTVVWGLTLFAAVGVPSALFVPEVRRWLRLPRIARVAALVVPALLTNAWFLLPTIAYESHTEISHRYEMWRLTLKEFMSVVSAAHLFAIGRSAAVPADAAFVVALPVLAIAWALVGMPLVLRRGLGGAWTRMLLIFAAVTVLMAIVMTHASFILALPRPYAILQFSYRLDSYVLLGVSATMLAVLVLARDEGRRGRVLTCALAPVVVLAVVGAVRQAGGYPGYSASRQAAVEPSLKPGPRETGWLDYIDAALPRVARRAPESEIEFPPASLRDDRASLRVRARPGQMLYTNIGGGPEFVRVRGAKIVGIDPEGNDVLEVGPNAGASKGALARNGASVPSETISVAPSDTLPVVLGRLLSFASVAFLAGLLAVLAIRRARATASRHAG